MHTNQTFNSLVIENPSILDFPEETKPYLISYDWSDVSWNAIGLPAFDSYFCLTGDQLYFESGEDKEVKLRKESFSGHVIASAVITPGNCDKVFIATFELVFCKGVLCGNELKELAISPRDEYEAGFKQFVLSNEKTAKIRQTLWFKYLYRPYFFILKWTTLSMAFIVEFVLKRFIWLAEKLTPVKL